MQVILGNGHSSALAQHINIPPRYQKLPEPTPAHALAHAHTHAPECSYAFKCKLDSPVSHNCLSQSLHMHLHMHMHMNIHAHLSVNWNVPLRSRENNTSRNKIFS